MKVMKFGGSCLQSRAGLERMIDLIRSEPRPLVIVLSALKGVTDALVELVEEAARTGARPDLAGLRRRHEQVLTGLTGEHLDATRAELAARLDELERVLTAVAALREVPPHTRDRLLGLGERMSVVLAGGHLGQQGLPARCLVADEAGIVTTDEPGDARVLARAEELVRERIRADEDLVYVVPGFVGRTRDGHWTTLGRGGSDTTATFLAAALGGAAILWKDAAGLLTADPRVVAAPRVIETCHYLDALELAHYGLPAIAQKAVHPARRAGIPIEIRSFEAGDAPSRIGDVQTARLAVTFVPEVVMIDLLQSDDDLARRDEGGESAEPAPGRGLFALGRFLEGLARAEVAPLLLTEASPAGDTTVVVRAGHRSAVERVLAREARQLEAQIRGDLAAVSLIGSGMRGKIGFAASVFDCLARESINIDAIAQTASERNISVIVARDQAEAAVRALHRRFVEEEDASGP